MPIRARVILCDLKGGVELGIFEGFSNVEVYSRVESIARALEGVVEEMEARFRLMREKGVEKIHERNFIFIAVDEASLLYGRVPKRHPEHIAIEKARMATQKILKLGRAANMESKTLTWNRWHDHCLKRMRMTLREGTIFTYDKCLKRWLSPQWTQKPLDKITGDDVYALIFEHIPTQDGHTKNIQKKVLERIRRILAMAVEEGLLGRNPSVGVNVKVPPPKKKVLTSGEANALLQAAKDCRHRFYPHWAMALFTGLRNGELYALRWADVDLETGLICVNKQWTSKDGLHATKNNRNRVVPICKELKKLLLELKAKGPFSEKLWPGIKKVQTLPEGHPERAHTPLDDLVLPRLNEWRHGEQSRHLGAFCRSIGIEDVKFHDLRATLITNMLSQGVSLAKVMAIVGHSQMSTTNEYLRLAGVEIRHDTTDKLGYRLPEEGKDNLINFFDPESLKKMGS